MSSLSADLQTTFLKLEAEYLPVLRDTTSGGLRLLSTA